MEVNMMIENMNSTPLSNRLTIGIFGRRNAGKSSMINAITGQNIAVTSDIAGTTTDPVFKTMELLPIGPVVFIDTAGLDDFGELGKLRTEKTYEVMRKCNLALVVIDSQAEITEFEEKLFDELNQRRIPSICVLNKCDKARPATKVYQNKILPDSIPVVYASAITGEGIGEVKRQIIAKVKYDMEPPLVSDLIRSDDMVVLVIPIDRSAPKGRLILPQQQVIRDILDCNANAVLTKENELKLTLERLNKPPAIVITDSQVFHKVSIDTPDCIPLTSFSILFARQKGNLAEMVRGVKRIERLIPNDRVLIVEGCTHHRQDDDIGTVKIPRWIRQIAGEDIQFEWASGVGYPKNLNKFSLIVHCGGCMLNRKEMQYRIAEAHKQGVAITNYGVLIAYVKGILKRALGPFPEAKHAFEN
jgi:[FeFe] hydrogenase H-cluster maturation GTPase HydF